MSQIIQLISGPRNISTAMMYSFGNRRDTAIVDEPFYAYYLTNFDVEHPGAEETIASQSSDPNLVISDILNAERGEAYLFVKNMAHHMQGYDYSYSYQCRNVFLIRDPKRLIRSFAKVITSPVADDLGLKREAEIYDEVKQHGRFDPIVVDSGELLKDPPKVIGELCDRLDIPFDPDMLFWSAGARAEDGVWAPHWYDNVHRSTGFVQQRPDDFELDPKLVPIYKEVLPYYQQLFEKSIKA